MASRSFVGPSLQELNSEALAGSADACLELARRSVACESFEAFLDSFVPDCDVMRVFDVYADAWYRVRQERAMAELPTLEVPVPPTNLNAGYS
jgi:hypothetical protein